MTTKPAEAAISQVFETLQVETNGPGFADQTRAVSGWLSRVGAGDGIVTLFIRHTSASLVIQENADPDVQTDLLGALDRLAPRDAPYVHDVEGPDDMPAHVKEALTQTSLSIPVRAGKMLLGTWQGVYVVEHRDRPHRREVVLHYLGTLGS